MRSDLMNAEELRRLRDREDALRQTLKSHGDNETVERQGDALLSCLHELTPRRAMPGFRENIEVLAVAVAVAMGVRTYFIQPFKIPTGSMQPSLYGITSEDRAEPMWHDHMPVKLVKWFITGEWYRQIQVAAGGHLSAPEHGNPAYPADCFFTIAGHRYRVPKSALNPMTGAIRCSGYGPGDYVEKGAVLWAGSRTAGDHVFVDKISWNFRRPKRGQIMVFSTRGIEDLEQSLAVDSKGKPISTHYIKRMAGLPGETLQIRPPELIINGESVKSPEGIRRIAERDTGYDGYRLEGRMTSPDDQIRLGKEEYFALGDNTGNSRDGRYWGTVPAKNLVGPAFAIYWPFHPACRDVRWGLAR